MPDTRIEQALFGYEDGHRLLASSMPLPGDVISDFTVLSDLAPGIRFEESDGYWTGVPAPQIKSYALMRTWPAFEMARPGCVWSHVLFIPTVTLEREDDLRKLTTLARRPKTPSERDAYAFPLVPSFKTLPELEPDQFDRASEILSTLYAPGRPRLVATRPGELDALIFEIWSQQWPKLRRNFRFQTAVTDRPVFLDRKFDIQLSREGDTTPEIEPAPTSSRSGRWIATAAADLATRGKGGLRRFLRTYGRDVTRPRYSFPPLVRVFDAASGSDLKGSAAYDVLELVGEAFSEPGDALTLKQALISNASPALAADLISLLNFLLISRHGDSYPPASPSVFEHLATFWPDRAKELLELAEVALTSDRPIANSILDAVLAAVPDDEFWPATALQPNLQSIALQRRPELLLGASREAVSDAALLRILTSSELSPVILSRLMPRLLDRDDAGLADWAASVAPALVREALIARLGAGANLPKAWIRLISLWPEEMLSAENIVRVKSWLGLYRITEVIGFDSPYMMVSEPAAWVVAIREAQQDLSPDDQLHLSAALFWVSVLQKGRGNGELLTMVFDRLFAAADRSSLPHRTRAYLDQLMPRFNYGNYDVASRLLLAVAIGFTLGNLPKADFLSFTKNKAAAKGISKLLDAFPDGRKFLKSLPR